MMCFVKQGEVVGQVIGTMEVRHAALCSWNECDFCLTYMVEFLQNQAVSNLGAGNTNSVVENRQNFRIVPRR